YRDSGSRIFPRASGLDGWLPGFFRFVLAPRYSPGALRRAIEGKGRCRSSGRAETIEAFDRASGPPDAPALADLPLDMGIRPASNACSGSAGAVPDTEVNPHLGNLGQDVPSSVAGARW